MQNTFAYQCPHCSESVRISDDVLGEVVDCPVCGSPFKVDVPSAKPVDPHSVNGDTPEVDRPDRAEGELRCIHPAMFRTHPFWFLGYSILVLLGIAAIVMALGDSKYISYVSERIQIIVGVVLLLIGGAMLFKWWLHKINTTLTVTTKRTILRKGIIAKNTTEVQHDDVRNIQVHQNMYQRMIGVGELAVSSSGQDDLEIHANDIPQPDEVAEVIRGLQ